MTDYTRAQCLDLDPEEFSDSGTPVAWAACEACPIRRGCLGDAMRLGTHGVYRGGVAFGEVSGKVVKNARARRSEMAREQWAAWLRLSERGVSVSDIARLANRDRSTVLHGLRQARQ